MPRGSTRPNAVAIIVGLIIGAVCGTLIGFITQWWGPALGFAVVVAVVWVIAQHAWMRRAEKQEIEDPFDGR